MQDQQSILWNLQIPDKNLFVPENMTLQSQFQIHQETVYEQQRQISEEPNISSINCSVIVHSSYFKHLSKQLGSWI